VLVKFGTVTGIRNIYRFLLEHFFFFWIWKSDCLGRASRWAYEWQSIYWKSVLTENSL